MASLFSKDEEAAILKTATNSKSISKTMSTSRKQSSINSELQEISKNVVAYFPDSPAILINTEEQLHEYVTALIAAGYAGIDTETTGLDRYYDHIVGASLYYPGGVEAYIPSRHMVPIFNTPYKNQLTYEQIAKEFRRIADSNVRLLFANADFDLSMIYKDIGVDFCDNFYYDVILAWRCLKENELHNGLKELYNKYVLKGSGDPKKFTDFFSPELFPYCDPEVAKLYAANDAKITYDLFRWQLPYTQKDHPKCKKSHLEAISDLIWNVEFPLVKSCQHMHRRGISLDKDIAKIIGKKYHSQYDKELEKVKSMVQDIIDSATVVRGTKARPFTRGEDFNPTSPLHVKYLLYTLMNLPEPKKGGTGKDALADINLPITKQIVKVRSLSTLIGTFVDKMPEATTPDGKIHAQFKQIGAGTGRMCIAEGTPITCLNGTKPIEDIVPGDIVYCYDTDTHGLKLSRVKNLWLTGKDRDCVRIKWQSSGKGDIGELICTPEHLIMKKSGEWCRADSLKRYDKLAHLRRTSGAPREPRPCLYGWDGLFIREQDLVKSEIFGCHDTSMIVHHKDEDVSNNQLENLQLMTKHEHLTLHGKLRAERGQLNLIKSIHSQKAGEARRKTRIENNRKKVLASRPKLLQMIKDCQGRISKVPCDYTSFLNRCRIAGIDVEAECRKYDPKYHRVPIERDEFMEVYETNSGSAIRITQHFDISYDKFYSYCNEFGISRNHMVQTVTPCGKYDVYDIEVEDYHNFIAGEICVHNSSANPNMQNIPSHADDIRHMFRSTPEVIQDIDCHVANGILEVEVNHFDFVKVDGEFVEVANLTEDSLVTVLVGKQEVRCKLNEPVNVSSNSCRVTLRLNAAYTNIFDNQKVTIKVKTPPYVLLSSDYSAQEPRITAHVSNDPGLIDAFIHNRDVYATIASISFGVPYEKCLEFHPETHEYQPEGKARRNEAKFILLGICYGRSVPSIAEQLYGTRDDMTDEEKTKKAQYVYDSVMNNFPGLRNAMISSQNFARKHGYVETILGRRRHLPDMQLPEFEFKAIPGYVNPDIDPLDISTLSNKSQIPERVVAQLTKEFAGYKYFGQIAKRTKELYEQKIRVINNRKKIGDATRQVLNSIIQGSAAEQTKMAILKIDNDPDWARIGGHILIPVHDEIIAEVPIKYVEEGGTILSKCMVDAASFLPFPSKCDVETMINWYSLSYPCPYIRPTKLTNLTEDEIKWVQYYLFCAGYELPIIPNDDGSDLKGDAAKGVNGKTSPEYYSLLEEYMKYYRISEDEFIDHIEKRVINGVDSLVRN